MITKELLEYIKSQKAKNIDEDEIKRDLTHNNWVIEDIEEALEKVNSIDPDTPFDVEIKDRDKVLVIDSEVSHPATKYTENLEAPIGDKPKVIANVISLLMIVVTFLFMYKAGLMIAIMSVVDYYSQTTGAMHYFLGEFPLYGWVVMAFVLSACIVLYSSFKVKVSSKSSFWFALITLLVLPVSLSYINYKLMSSVADYFSADPIVFNQNIPSIPSKASTIIIGIFGEPAFFISLAILFILIFSYKKFHLPKQTMSSRDRKVYLIFVLLFMAPTLFVITRSYSKARSDDFGYKIAQSRTGFHIYRPDPIPLGMVYLSNYIPNREMAGKNDAVQVTYDFAYKESIDLTKSRPIVLKQVRVDEKFSLSKFLEDDMGVYSNSETVSIPQALDSVGYLVKNRLSYGEENKNLVFLTKDKVLISISTVDSSHVDLIDLAKSLK